MALPLQGTSEAAMHIPCLMNGVQTDTGDVRSPCLLGRNRLQAGHWRQRALRAYIERLRQSAYAADVSLLTCICTHQQVCQQRALDLHPKSIVLWASRLGSTPLGNAALKEEWCFPCKMVLTCPGVGNVVNDPVAQGAPRRSAERHVRRRGAAGARSGLPVSFAARSRCCFGLRGAAFWGKRSNTGAWASCAATWASSAAISSRMALEASSSGNSSLNSGCPCAAAPAAAPPLKGCCGFRPLQGPCRVP